MSSMVIDVNSTNGLESILEDGDDEDPVLEWNPMYIV